LAVKPASALAIALAAAAALPATALASTQTRYTVAKAAGTEKVEFTADGDTCAQFLTCGYGGTVTYKFGGAPSGRLLVKQGGNGHVTGAAAFKSRGTTVSDVTSGPVCNDTVQHKREEFSLRSKSRLGRLVFGLHGGTTDYLVTDCAGPTEAALAHDNALPSGTFKRQDFDAPSTTFGLTGSSNFREAGYVGSVTWKLKYKLRRTG
jgi:hypothetical protein